MLPAGTSEECVARIRPCTTGEAERRDRAKLALSAASRRHQDSPGLRPGRAELLVPRPTSKRLCSASDDASVADVDGDISSRGSACLAGTSTGFMRGSALDDPYDIVIHFADSLRGECVRIGWIAPTAFDNVRRTLRAHDRRRPLPDGCVPRQRRVTA